MGHRRTSREGTREEEEEEERTHPPKSPHPPLLLLLLLEVEEELPDPELLLLLLPKLKLQSDIPEGKPEGGSRARCLPGPPSDRPSSSAALPSTLP